MIYCISKIKWSIIRSVSSRVEVYEDMGDQVEYMIHNIGEDSFQIAHVYDSSHSDKEESLFWGAKNFT